MALGRIEKGPCAHCSIREMAKIGCCVQGQMPDGEGLKLKTIRNSRTGNTMQACEWLDPTEPGNRCTNPNPPEDCLSFTCGK